MSHRAFILRRLPLAITALSAFGLAVQAQAAFIEDSQASLTLKNYYLDRNYVGETNIAARREWAQGFILRAQSGYTEGHVGFGLDAIAQLGIKLDSSPDRVGTGLLPVTASGAPDEYSHLGLTAKARVSKTDLQVGTVMPFLPILFSSPARLLMQTFRGGYLRSQDIDGLSLHIGYLDRMNLRDSTDFQPFRVAAPNGRFNGGAESNKFMFAGGDYKFTPELTLRYYHAQLDDIYKQDFLGAVHQLDLGQGSLRTDLRYFISNEHGQARAGAVDNRNLGVFFSYGLGSHTLGAGYMKLTGDTAMPYIAGSEPLVHTEGALSAEFLNPDERVWQVKYDYDFAGMGAPGLKGMIRYIKGTNISLPHLGGENLHEKTRDVELAYTVQGGLFKDVALRLRHARYRNNFAPTAAFRSGDETRINIDYTFRF